jgi:ABC-type branched-subunit amino acid transport system ATPase component/ABC-type branched-subunit amino acid transport system permease subunit
VLTDAVAFALLGLGGAAVTCLLASGIVVIYRGSGVVNFAQGSMAVVGGYAYFALSDDMALPFAVVLAVLITAACGLATELIVMWPMRQSSPLSRVIATLAISAVITQVISNVFGDTPQFVHSFLPSGALSLGDSIVLPQNRLWLYGIAIVTTIVLWQFYRLSRFGLATSAGAENQDAVAALGWSPRLLAAVNWAIGAALAGLAGVLFVCINGVSQEGLLLTIIPALSAALIGSFRSFPLTLAGATLVGILQSEITRFVSTPGWNVVGPFAVIVIILVVRNRSIPERSFLTERLPHVGTGQLSPVGIALVVGTALASLQVFDYTWSQTLATSAIAVVICLSLVLVTGYAGQISLTQFALSGLGALIVSRLAEGFDLPFLVAVVLGVLLIMPIGALVALPALRARGLSLAVLTLGLAMAIDSAILTNVHWTGGLDGIQLKPATIFGMPVDSLTQPQRYATVCVLAAALVGILVANIRRGRVGRLLLAVRENERAAASLGISALPPKLYAFAVGAGIAGLAGALSAYQFFTVDFSGYSPLVDITYVLLIVVGGLGYISGATFAGVLAVAGIGEYLVDRWVGVSDTWQLIVALLLLVQLVFTPDGAVHEGVHHVGKLKAKIRRRPPTHLPREFERAHVNPKVLELDNVVVEFGASKALDGLSLKVHPGEVVGLIGPNGAGKTTLIDVATGFVRAKSGTVRLDGTDITAHPAHRRARSGLTRSWQSQELFGAMTVEENLRTGAEPVGGWAYLTSPFWNRRTALPGTVVASISQFGLEGVLDAYPDNLPYAVRRLVGIARSVASAPSVLLLDEPAAGLDETSTRELGELLRRLAREWNVGILLVEHDVALVMRTCDRVVAIDFGKEMASGTPSEVRTNPRVVEAYLGGATTSHAG